MSSVAQEKACDICGTIYPNTVDYFRPTGSGVPRGTCRECDRTADRERWHGKREPLALIPGNAEQFYDRERQMYSLTAMWRAAGCPKNRTPAAWLRLPDTQRFLAELAEQTMGESHSLADINSAEGRAGGTWAHWQVAVEYAGYLSPSFAIQWNEYAAAYIRGEQRPDVATVRSVSNAPIVRQLSEVHSDVVWIRQKLETVGALHHFYDMPGGIYLARFAIEEFTNPASRLEHFGVSEAAKHLERGYIPACIGKYSGPTPGKRIDGHHGKLLVDDLSVAVTWMRCDQPTTAETFLRNNAPAYPIAFKLSANNKRLKDWFWVQRAWIEQQTEAWPTRILLTDLTAKCRNWRFEMAVVYAQSDLGI